MNLLAGKKGLVFGIANDRSIAFHIAQNAMEAGATCAFPHLPGEKNERRVFKALESVGRTNEWLIPCDVSNDDDLDATFAQVKERFDALDFVVHSVAFADRAVLKPGIFPETSRQAFAQALDISAFSLVAIANRAKALMPGGGSIVAMTYYGSQKAVPGYNVMGVAKAALEASSRYLASDLGPHGIRVNTVSAGPIRTLSAMAVGGIDEIFQWVEQKAPLRRNVTADEVGKTVLYLLSDLSSGVTGTNLFVDAGFSQVGL